MIGKGQADSGGSSICISILLFFFFVQILAYGHLNNPMAIGSSKGCTRIREAKDCIRFLLRLS